MCLLGKPCTRRCQMLHDGQLGTEHKMCRSPRRGKYPLNTAGTNSGPGPAMCPLGRTPCNAEPGKPQDVFIGTHGALKRRLLFTVFLKHRTPCNAEAGKPQDVFIGTHGALKRRLLFAVFLEHRTPCKAEPGKPQDVFIGTPGALKRRLLFAVFLISTEHPATRSQKISRHLRWHTRSTYETIAVHCLP